MSSVGAWIKRLWEDDRRDRVVAVLILGLVAALFLQVVLALRSEGGASRYPISLRPPGAVEIGRFDSGGIDGLLKLRPVERVIEIVWASPLSPEEIRRWYVDKFLRRYNLEREGEDLLPVTLVGGDEQDSEIAVGLTFTTDKPALRELLPSLIGDVPEGTEGFVTVRIVDR